MSGNVPALSLGTRPIKPGETAEEWVDRVLAERGPMPDRVVERLRRVITAANAEVAARKTGRSA